MYNINALKMALNPEIRIEKSFTHERELQKSLDQNLLSCIHKSFYLRFLKNSSFKLYFEKQGQTRTGSIDNPFVCLLINLLIPCLEICAGETLSVVE